MNKTFYIVIMKIIKKEKVFPWEFHLIKVIIANFI